LLWNLLFWAVIVMLTTLTIDCLYVMWPYPDGAAGLTRFQANIQAEWTTLVRLSGDRFPKMAYAIHDVLYRVLFKWPGFDYLITRAHDPAPLSGMSEMMRKAVLATNTFWGTAAAGLQLFSMRLAVLTLALPLLALASLGAAADGLVGWYLRRTGGGRESGFIYHRAKRHGGHTLLILCLAYLAPPATVDPRIAIPIATAAIAVAVRFAVSRFKKYV
jgi:integrating conjugative element membrane protein (TIGR03747 family)